MTSDIFKGVCLSGSVIKRPWNDVFQLGWEKFFEYLCREKKYGPSITMMILGGGAVLGTSDTLGNQVIKSLLMYLFPKAMASLAANAEPAFWIQFLGGTSWAFGLIIFLYLWITSNWKEVHQTIVQASYSPISTSPLKSIIDPDGRFWKTIIHLQFFKINNSDISTVTKYKKLVEKKVAVLKPGRPTYYCGIAHLPFVAYAGHLLRNFPVRFLEIDHNSRKAMLLKDSNESSFDLHSSHYTNNLGDEVSLAISISRNINNEEILKLKKGIPIVEIKAKTIEYSNIKSEKQIEKITADIRAIMENLSQVNPNLKKINIFYAGQTSLMFRFGQIITPNTDKEIVVYNYDGKLGYCWGISLNKGGDIVQL